MPNETQKVQITLNSVKVTVPPGVYQWNDFLKLAGLATTTKTLTVTDQAARSGAALGGNHSVQITGGETITSA